MFIAALFTKARRWKKTLKFSSMNEWGNKLWYIHTTEYYSAIKRNEVLMHDITWTNIENMLHERSKTQKVT